MRTLSVLLLLSVAAIADEPRADELYHEGRYQQALDEYIAAYDSSASPDYLFNIGQCHARLGHHQEAIFFYRGYLERGAHVDRAAVEALIRTEEQRARPKPSLYKKWWLWTAVAVVVVAASATAIALTAPAETRLPSGPLGTIDAR